MQGEIKKLHDEAMDYCLMARHAKAQKQYKKSLKLFWEAFRSELRAYYFLTREDDDNLGDFELIENSLRCLYISCRRARNLLLFKTVW